MLQLGGGTAVQNAMMLPIIDFMDTIEYFIPGGDPILLAGDFNIDRFRNGGDEEFLYRWILDEEFDDAYADGTTDALNELCELEN